MAQPDSERQAVLNSLVDLYDPARHRVLMVTDTNHYRYGEGFEFARDLAVEMKAKGIQAIGLEFIPTYDQTIMDAFYNGEITREQFLYLHRDQGSSGQVSDDDVKKLYENLADLMEQGIRVYGLNTHAHAPGRPEAEKAYHEYKTQEGAISVDFMKYVGQHKIDNVDKAAECFDHLAGNGQHSPELQKILADMPKTDEAAAAYKAEHLETIFKIMHPQHSTLQQLEKAVQSMDMVDLDANSIEHGYMEKRLSADQYLADHVMSILQKEPGLIIHYGMAHSLDNLSMAKRAEDAPDLDAALRQRGVGVMIVDPYFGADTVNCSPLMREQLCELWPEVMNIIQQAAETSNDPDRYVVPDVKGSEVKPVRPQPPAGP